MKQEILEHKPRRKEAFYCADNVEEGVDFLVVQGWNVPWETIFVWRQMVQVVRVMQWNNESS